MRVEQALYERHLTKPVRNRVNRGDSKYHGGLQSRELCQAPIMQVLSSHLRVCEFGLSFWNNFFQSCRRQGSSRGPSDKKASAKSTPPRGTHFVKIHNCPFQIFSLLINHNNDLTLSYKDRNYETEHEQAISDVHVQFHSLDLRSSGLSHYYGWLVRSWKLERSYVF